jgi:hypothetical protein
VIGLIILGADRILLLTIGKILVVSFSDGAVPVFLPAFSVTVDWAVRYKPNIQSEFKNRNEIQSDCSVEEM